MNRRAWFGLLVCLVFLVSGSMHAGRVWAAPRTPTPTPPPPTPSPTFTATPTPSPTPAPTPTPSPPATPTPRPTPTPTPTPALWLSRVEPTTLVAGEGGTLTVYGAGFDASTLVRLVGIGVLSTRFLSPGILQATIPPTVPPGTYSAEVIRGDGTGMTLVDALTVVAPTPVPTPTPSAPPPGQPILMLSNYSVQPLSVLPGQRFTVQVEVFNGGSRPTENALFTFQTSTFVPIQPTGHYVRHIPINGRATVRQVFYAPESLTPGTYPITVLMEGNDFEGKHYQYQATVTVAVAEKRPPGQPQLVIERATTVPAQVRPGDALVVRLVARNVGEAAARNVSVRLAGGQVAIPGEQGSRVAVGDVAASQAVTVTFALTVNPDVKPGHYTLPVHITYADAQGAPQSVEEEVGLEVIGRGTAGPRLLVVRYTTTPAIPAPGSPVTVTVRLQNVGDTAARRVFLAWGGEGGEGLGALALIGTGNVHYIESVGPGEAVDVNQPFFLDGEANPGIHTLPLQLTYQDAEGNTIQDRQVIALRVRRRPMLLVQFYEDVGTPLAGVPFPLPIEVVNLDTAFLNVTTVEVSSETLDIQNGRLFVGGLEGGTTVSLDATAVAPQGGQHTVVVSVHYLDDFHQMAVLTRTLTVEVMEPTSPPEPVEQVPSEEPPEAQETSWLQRLWQFLRGLLGLGS